MSAAAPAAKVKKAAKPKKPAAHPTYKEMVQAAISNLKERKGSSRVKIKRYISQNYKVNEDKMNTSLNLAIRKSLTSKSLVKVKGSFKLGSAAEKKPKAKKPKATKPKVKKAVKTKKAGEKKAKPAAKKPKKPKTPKKKTAKSPAKKAAKPKTVKKSPKKVAKKPAKKAAKKPAAKK